MKCPFCNSENVEVPTVNNGIGEQQCGPAMCNACLAYQEKDGTWVKEYRNPNQEPK